MDKIRLLIASDDSSSRRGLTAIFASESRFEVIGDFAMEEAIEKSILFQPDAVLIDLSGDILNSGQKINHLKNQCPCSIVLALIGNENSDKLMDLLAKGIDSCVPRGIIRGCLVEAVELACRTGLVCLPGTFKKAASFAGSDRVVNICDLKGCLPGNGEYLTRREMEILQLMAKNCSNREIAHKLFISEPTVKTHVSSILRKLGQNNRAQAIVYSYKIGLVKEISGCM